MEFTVIKEIQYYQRLLDNESIVREKVASL